MHNITAYIMHGLCSIFSHSLAIQTSPTVIRLASFPGSPGIKNQEPKKWHGHWE